MARSGNGGKSDNKLFTSPTLGVTGDSNTDLALTTTHFDQELDFSEGQDPSLPADEHPVLHNVVATFSTSCALDLKSIITKARNVEYNPRRFPALIMRIRDPKSTALMFASGKVVVTGAKTEALCRLAGRKFTRILQKLDYPAVFQSFKISNLVATARTNFPIRLEGLLLKHANFANYEPELFPGLIYRMLQPKVVLLIFVSGQIVFTGVKEYENIERAFRLIVPVLREYRKEAVLVLSR